MRSPSPQHCKEIIRRAFVHLASGATTDRHRALSTLKPSRYSSRSTHRMAERRYRQALSASPIDGLTHPDATIRQDALAALA